MKNTNNKKDEMKLAGSCPVSYTNRTDKYNEVLKTLFWISLVVFFGMLAVNQTLGFFYKAHFLKAPCDLCTELNPNQSICIDNCFTIKKELFPDGLGKWKDLEGNCYDFYGHEEKCPGENNYKINNNNNKSLGYYFELGTDEVYTKPETQSGNFTKVNKTNLNLTLS